MSDSLLTFPIWPNRKFEPSTDVCFVLMPFKGRTNTVFRTVIEPSATDAGLKAVRADQLYGLNVVEELWTRINEARVIVADLSHANANVFYELGIAHTLGKVTILLRSGSVVRTPLPFDVRILRVIPYTSSRRGLTLLRKELTESLSEVLEAHPFGSELRTLLHDRATSWTTSYYDPLVLLPEHQLMDLRRNLAPSDLDDLEVAFCVATAAHYGSVDNIIHWGRACRDRPQAASYLAHVLFKHHRRPKYRIARVLEQCPPKTQKAAIRTLLENIDRVPRGLIEAIERGTVVDYVKRNAGRDLDRARRLALMRELTDVVL
jgi:hypothetical protein